MNLPTKLTVMRIILVPVFVAFFVLPFFAPSTASFSGFVALAIFLIACLTDFLDGYLARKWNQITTLGKFLDPIADKLLVAAALFCVVLFQVRYLQAIMLIFAVIIISRELLVSAFRMLAASKSINLAADKLGKYKTVFQMLALIVLIPIPSIQYRAVSGGIAAVYYPFVSTFDFATIGVGLIYSIGFVLLGVATIITVISGVNYIVKNRQVFKDERQENEEPN